MISKVNNVPHFRIKIAKVKIILVNAYNANKDMDCLIIHLVNNAFKIVNNVFMIIIIKFAKCANLDIN